MCYINPDISTCLEGHIVPYYLSDNGGSHIIGFLKSNVYLMDDSLST